MRNFIRDNALSRALTRIVNVAHRPDQIARTPEQIEQFFQFSEDDERVSVSTALRVAAVYSCVRLLSTSQAMLPLMLMRREGKKKTEATEHPVSKLFRQPNAWQTSFEFESMLCAHKHLRGNAYAYISRIGNRPVELIPLNPDHMEVEQKGLEIRYKYRVPGKGEVRYYNQRDIHHRRGLTTDGLYGLSPISAARRAIGLSVHMEKHGRALFTNAAKPSGVLQSPKPLTPEAARRLKDSFDDVYAGSENAHKTIVLEDGLEWKQVGMSAEDSQFLESRKFERNEIAMFWGVPPHMIGDIERGTSWGSGIEQQSLGFLVHTLNPHLVNDQQALARDLLNDGDRLTHTVVHDTNILTRAQFMTRQQGLEIQYRNGVINPDEWRQIEGLNPREDGQGDRYVEPGAITGSGSQNGSADGNPDAATEDTEDAHASAN